jgi:hypothetical protein
MALLDVAFTLSRSISGNGASPSTDSTTEYFLKGLVDVSSSPFDALIRVYRKDTGALLASGRSNRPKGKFQVSWMGYDGPVFWIAFDDSGSPIYNAKVLDLVYGI